MRCADCNRGLSESNKTGRCRHHAIDEMDDVDREFFELSGEVFPEKKEYAVRAYVREVMRKK